MYRTNGRRKRDTLGQFPIVTLAEARQLARQRLAKLVLEDKNPHFTPTTNFAEAVADFLQLHCAVRNKPRTAGETERLSEPPLASGIVAQDASRDPDTGCVGRARRAAWHAKHSQCNALAAVRKFFNWARQRRLVDRSPCEGLQLGVRVAVAHARALGCGTREGVPSALSRSDIPTATSCSCWRSRHSGAARSRACVGVTSTRPNG